MSGIDSKNAAAAPRGWLTAIAHHVLHNWAGILLVSSLITIAKTNSAWLTAFDGYTFLIVSNVASAVERAFKHNPEAVVVLIDQNTFELRYRERTPLNRCELTRDLQAIYLENPNTVAVDLDISPAVWLQEAPDGLPKNSVPDITNECPTAIASEESQCQQQLYNLIRCAAHSGIRTILVAPPPAANSLPYLQQIKDEWQQKLGAGLPDHIHFAQTNLREELGMLLTYKTAPDSMPIVARRLACPAGEEQHACKRRVIEADESDTAYVDARTFLYELRFMPLSRFERPTDFATELRDNLTTIRAHYGPDSGVVFFGGGYGQSDVFASSLGKMYGVEALAGIYVSNKIATNPVLDFAADFISGTLFGMYIAYRWRLFFEMRSNENPRTRQRGPVSIFKLAISLALVTGGAIVIAVFLISVFGIWFSPVPMFIGMIIDSFISGSVEQALNRYRQDGYKERHHSNLEIFFRPLFLGAFRLFKRDRQAALIVAGWNCFFVVVVGFALFSH